jgi:hypothetical protein
LPKDTAGALESVLVRKRGVKSEIAAD